MAAYKITVNNRSGRDTNYIITSERPSVEGPNGNTWPLVVRKARVPADGSALFSINIPNPYFAYAITLQGEPNPGSSTEITSKRPVTLGKTEPNGKFEPGSSVIYEIDDGAARLRDDDAKQGAENAFEIKTGDFSPRDWDDVHYLIGYGSAEGPWAGFTPEPRVSYQIQPSAVFWLVAGDLAVGSLIDVQSFGAPLKLDFSVLGKHVRVTERETGELVIDK